MRLAKPICGAIFLSALVLAAPSASATTSADAVALLSMQRVANGIPALSEDPALSDGCEKHLRYLKLNGLGPTHGEDPALPGYTPEGSMSNPAAVGSEVLAENPSYGWSSSGNPWWSPLSQAPLHAYIMFSPTKTVAGYAEIARPDSSPELVCMRLNRSGPDSAGATPEAFSVPGPGATAAPSWRVVGEGPYAPQQLVGIPQGVEIGPTILLYMYAREVSPEGWSYKPSEILSASVVGPDGPVEVRAVDSRTHVAGIGDGPTTGGFLVLPQPLRPFSDYEATVVWRGTAADPGPLEQRIPFRTSGRVNRFSVKVDVDPADRLASIAVQSVDERPMAPGGVLTLSGPGGERRTYGPGAKGREALFDDGSYEVHATGLRKGGWQACATSGGPATGWEEATECRQFAMPGKVRRKRHAARLLSKTLRIRKGRLRLRLSCPTVSGGPCKGHIFVRTVPGALSRNGKRGRAVALTKSGRYFIRAGRSALVALRVKRIHPIPPRRFKVMVRLRFATGGSARFRRMAAWDRRGRGAAADRG